MGYDRVIVCSVASITVYWTDDGMYKSTVAGFANASLPCVLGSRLLFNLNEAAEKDSNGSADRSVSNISDMQFT